MASKPTSGKKPAAPAPQKAGEVAEVKGKQELILVQDQAPAHIKQGQQRGSENVTSNDLVIPRLEVIQALSPIVKEGDPKFNPQARPGMLVNSVTGRLYGKETFLVPVHYTKQWLVWKKRKDANGRPLEGGFLGAFNSPEEAQDRIKQAVKEGMNEEHLEVLDTPQHLCLLVDAGAGGSGDVCEIMLSMPRTKAKISRQWNSMIKLAGGDRFSRVYRIGTQMEKNPKGDFYNYVLASVGHPAKPLYDRAEKLYASVQGGRTYTADHSDAGAGEADADPEM